MLDIDAWVRGLGHVVEPTIHSEVERKFLIAKPNLAKLHATIPMHQESMIQTYLKTGTDEQEVRVRDVKNIKGNRSWWVTEKTDIPSESSSLVRLEKEWSIPQGLYAVLKHQYGDVTIVKHRVKIAYKLGNCLEIDIYPFWKSQAILEIENPATEGGKLLLPPGIRVIKEVTHNASYTNRSLARRYVSREKL